MRITLRPNQQACNNCGNVFRIRLASTAYAGAKGISIAPRDIDPYNPLCTACRRKEGTGN